MKILLDILHPAHVHFFRSAITNLKKEGHKVFITARDKDLTLKLLNLYKITYNCISTESGSKMGLSAELLSRNRKLISTIRKEGPSVLASIGGISTAQAGFLTRTRNLTFYDTENATVSNLLSYPFATEVVTPDCYRGWVPKRKHVTYAGYHELAYLHPARFTPDADVLRAHGVDPEEPFSVIRFVSWKALHDVKARGLTLKGKRKLVQTLEKLGKIYITSETGLPAEFEPYRLPITPEKIHHLLAFANLFIGESATMASESVILGTPAVYIDAAGRGYTDEQEEKYGLCSNFKPWQIDEAVSRAGQLMLDNVKNIPSFRARVDQMLSDKIDVTEFVVSRLLDM